MSGNEIRRTEIGVGSPPADGVDFCGLVQIGCIY
jgi:hypothetical protein